MVHGSGRVGSSRVGTDGMVVAEDSLDMEPMARDTDTVMVMEVETGNWTAARNSLNAVSLMFLLHL